MMTQKEQVLQLLEQHDISDTLSIIGETLEAMDHKEIQMLGLEIQDIADNMRAIVRATVMTPPADRTQTH